MISPEHAEEYTQALGQVVAGSWRHINLARRMGVPQALGLTLEEWVDERLGGYIRLSDAEFHAAVLELRKEGLNQRQIAQVTGVNQSTVSRREVDANASAASPTHSHQANSPTSNGKPDADASVLHRLDCDLDEDCTCEVGNQPLLVDVPMVSAAEAAIRELLQRFSYEELLAALEAVAR